MVSLSQFKHWAFSASAIAVAAGLSACGPSTTPSTPGTSGASGNTISISGAGATAPNPLYQRWFADFGAKNPNIQISYQSVGSGAGVKQFLEQTVDFGASDDPLKDEDRAKYPQDRGSGPVQVPTTGVFLTFSYNLDGIDTLKLSRATYCGILDGSIKNWNDAAIAKDNAGVTFPDLPIAFVHRSDGSGTTAIFTNHVAKACPTWKAGAGKSVEWPVGTGAKGNEGVTAAIQQTPGAIGYTEFSNAKEANLKMATLENKAGEFIEPSPEAAAKALDGAKPDENLVVKVPDPAGKDAYPIVSLTYLLLYEQYPDAAKGEALKSVVAWALKEASATATELGYIPLPETLVTQVASKLDSIKVAAK